MFNRFVSKTVFKSLMAPKYSANAMKILMMSSYSSQLVRVNKMGFFDYDNKDKNIFSSDEEDTKSFQRGKRTHNEEPSDSFFSQNDQIHEGKFEVEEIPLYINKMKREISELKKQPGNQRRNGALLEQSYFKKIRNLLSMYHQNHDQIISEYPRFATILYEFVVYHDIRKQTRALDVLEDDVVNLNLENMPIPGIRNFLQAMNISGRGRREVLDKVKKHLTERQAFNDIKSSVTICSALQNLRTLDNDYLHNTLKTVQDEIKRQIDNNAAKIESGIVVYGGFHRQMYGSVTRFLCDSDIKFTAAEVKDFVTRHPVSEANGAKFITANDKTTGIKDHILLLISQYALLQSSRKGSYAEILNHLYYNSESCPNKAIFDELKGFNTLITKSVDEFKQTIKESERKVKQSPIQSRISSCLTELGVYYKFNERVMDVFKVDFYLPESKTIFEYLGPSDYIKTEDTQRDKLEQGITRFRKSILQLHGHKLVNIDFYDMIATDNKHLELVKAIKDKLA